MSRIVWILAVLLSHWRRHPMQLATLLIGLISAMSAAPNCGAIA